MAVPYTHPRGTKAALDALATASGLRVGQIYLITDQARLAVATSLTAYTMFAKTTETGDADPLVLATEVTTDAPATGTPATGVRLFAAVRANRRLPAYISPTGRTERLQPFLGSNEVMIVDVPLGGTGYNSIGLAMAADVGTATTPALSITNALTMQARRVLSVAATINLLMEAKAAAVIGSRRLVGGGFHYTIRFGLETVLPATGRLFAGLNDSTAAIASGEVLGVLANAVGIFKNSADTTLRLMLSAAAATNQAVVLTNTGAVGWNVAGTWFQLEIFCKPGDTGFGYRVVRYTPGATPSTVAPVVAIDEGYVTAGNLPGIDTLFAPHLWAQNVSATASSIAFIQLYKESD